ncbi:hypothetical protein EGT07_06700 [Herbaspirillum sp. HC18]|nr:hypothetical protein EGT07_06700 [Herbaspirillum sp. HC18]
MSSVVAGGSMETTLTSDQRSPYIGGTESICSRVLVLDRMGRHCFFVHKKRDGVSPMHVFLGYAFPNQRNYLFQER